MFRHSGRSEEGSRFPGAGVLRGCEEHDMSAGNEALVPEQEAIALTTDPSLQPLERYDYALMFFFNKM